MSVKVMGLVWDLQCHEMINGLEFKPNHKFVLLAYADHADHHGKNIYPAISTISKKTGYKERNTQIITHDLNNMGLLAPDGFGPRGTNKWCIPLDKEGAKITPLQSLQGAEDKDLSGAIPSGAIPSGAEITPELKEPELENLYITNTYIDLWEDTKKKLAEEMPRASFKTWVEDTRAVHIDDSILWVAVRNDYSKKWLTENLTDRAQKLCGLYVYFMLCPEMEEA